MAIISVSSWWIPDLTLVGLVMTIVASPDHWLAGSVIAGSGVALFASRATAAILIAHVVMGGLVRWLITRWDLHDVRVQRLLVGAGSLSMTCWLAGVDRVWSLPFIGGAAARAVVTALSAIVVDRWFGPRAIIRP